MGYLSPQIEVLAKKKNQNLPSLVKKEHSCGIFQDYGKSIEEHSSESL